MHCPFLTESLVLIFAFIILTLSLRDKHSFVDGAALLAGFLMLGASALSLNLPSQNLFSGSYRVDALSQGFKTLLSLSFIFVVLFSRDTLIARHKKAEYYFFALLALLGMMMIPSANSILMLLLSLELSAYSLYVLSAFKKDSRSAESSVKYLIFGAATSGVFLWGASLVCGLAGSILLPEIAAKIPVLTAQPAFVLGLLLMTFSFLFKLSGFPAHFWAPDVYESAATPVTAFIATASKAAAVAAFVRFFLWTGIPDSLIVVLGALAFISMTLGNVVALVQRDVKRLLAYSSIAQAGYILLGLMSASPEGYSSSFFYATAYVLMNTGAFLVILLVAQSVKQDNPQFSDFDGLAEKSPFLSLLLLLSLLSLAGIPPLVGFTGKWILFTAAMEKGHWFLVLWAVLNSVVSLFYYLTLVKHAYLEKPKDKSPFAISPALKLSCLALIVLIIVLGVFPNPLISFGQTALKAGL